MVGASVCIPRYPETISLEIAPGEIVLNDWTVQGDSIVSGNLDIGQGEGAPPTFAVNGGLTVSRRRLDNQDAINLFLQTDQVWRPVSSVHPLQIASVNGTFRVARDGTFFILASGKGEQLSIANDSLVMRECVIASNKHRHKHACPCPHANTSGCALQLECFCGGRGHTGQQCVCH